MLLLPFDVMIKLGFHLSIAGSIANAPRYAGKMGYGDFQIFTSSSRAWANSEITKEAAVEFAGLTKRYSTTPFAHIPYLCNIASARDAVYENSKAMLVNNIRNCMALGIGCLVIHLGSHLGRGVGYGTDRICDALGFAFDRTSDVKILLENSSGYRNSVGSKLDEIGSMIDRLGNERIGACFDTCHAFAAGYDMCTGEGVDRIEQEFASQIGRKNLKLVHLNDAKFPIGSGLDRHWHIGKGYIGRKGFINLFRSRLFNHGFFVLETPGGEENRDMEEIKNIIRIATGRRL